MNILLAATAAVALSAGAAIAQPDRNDPRAQPASLVSVDLGGIAFGYRDGYWDNGHTWHRWNNDSDSRAYRARSGSHYYSRNHDTYSNNGWQR